MAPDMLHVDIGFPPGSCRAGLERQEGKVLTDLSSDSKKGGTGELGLVEMPPGEATGDKDN